MTVRAYVNALAQKSKIYALSLLPPLCVCAWVRLTFISTLTAHQLVTCIVLDSRLWTISYDMLMSFISIERFTNYYNMRASHGSERAWARAEQWRKKRVKQRNHLIAPSSQQASTHSHRTIFAQRCECCTCYLRRLPPHTTDCYRLQLFAITSHKTCLRIEPIGRPIRHSRFLTIIKFINS